MMNIKTLQDQLQRHQTYLAQDPSNPHLLLSIDILKATILHHEHRIDDAITLLETLKDKYPPTASITGLLALLYFDKHDHTQATVLAEATQKLDPNNYEGRLVTILLQTLQHKTTIADIDALIAINPSDCRLWYAAGLTHMHTFNLISAEHAFIQATTFWPDFYDCWICLGWCHLLQNKLELAQSVYLTALGINDTAADGYGGLAVIHALRQEKSKATFWIKKAQDRDITCFSTEVARAIINHSNDKASQKEHQDAATMNTVLTNAILALETKNRVLH
jgi:tetratricopeptide (TPR) repeat protein